jgi:hypothetical protein
MPFQHENRDSIFSEIFVSGAKIYGVKSLITIILLLTSAPEIEVISQNSKISSSAIFILMQREEWTLAIKYLLCAFTSS